MKVIPTHLPGAGAGSFDVKMIGALAVPCAFKAPKSVEMLEMLNPMPLLNLTVTPGSIVSVAPVVE